MALNVLSRVPADHVAIIEHLGRMDRVVVAGQRVGGVPLLDRVGRLISTRTHRLTLRDEPVVAADQSVMLVEASVDYRVVDAMAVATSVTDYQAAVSQVAIVTLRTLAGKYASDDMLMSSGAIAEALKDTLLAPITDWGLDVTRTEVAVVRHRPDYAPTSSTVLLDY